MNRDSDKGLLIGGVGGVYLLASPGKLVVEVYRMDLNPADGQTPLRAILLAPDRSVLQEQWILDAGEDGKGHVRFETDVAHKGVYGLNITQTGDRYGQRANWGFRTTCPHYLIETSRGHRDARHQEPIVCNNAEIAGDICFMPRQKAIALEADGLPKSVDRLQLFDSTGTVLQTLTVSDGRVSAEIPASLSRGDAPWRLHLPAFKGVFHIDGVTRWDRGDTYNGLSLWSPDISSWFNYFDYRWLLTPYHRTVYCQAGASRSLTFEVYNNGRQERTIDLTLGGDADAPALPALSTSQLTVGPGRAGRVHLDVPAPAAGQSYSLRLRATPRTDTQMTTFATISVHEGQAPAEEPISMPIVLKPYRHENRQFGYLPEYPTGNQIYFGGGNLPYVLSDSQVHFPRAGEWQAVPLRAVLDGKEEAVSQRSSKVAFDDEDTLYTVGTANRQAVLLISRDRGRTFQAAEIPGGGTIDIEQYSGHNIPQGPPPFVRFKRTARDPKLKWRSLNDLELFLPREHGEEVIVGDPVMLSRKCIGLSAHSGIPSTLVSRGNRVHIAWGEATDPQEDVPGVPTYVVTYERGKGLLGEPVLVGYGPPANDVHNSPCITIDSNGFLHVLIGTHGRTFKYARSRQPNSAHHGWTEPRDVGPGLRQTYVGLVCDQQDNLHLVFRLWRSGGEYFPAGSYAQLAHMVKPADGDWSKPKPLVVAPFSEYSIYYHRLTIDRRGRLFLSYDYWSTFWFYRTDHRGDRRAVIMSGDAGATWRFAGNEDLIR